MKKVYNKFTTSDIPLDASLNSSNVSTSKSKTASTKSSIKAIGSGTKKKTTTSLSKTSKQTKPEEKQKTVRSKLTKEGADLKDLEKLNEENIKSHSFRSKRNQVIVVLLSIFLVIAIAIIVIYAVLTKIENNCYLYVNGDARASYMVNGEEISQFRSPANIKGGCLFTVNIDLKIQDSGDFNVKFLIKCYNNDKLLTNVAIYEPNTEEEGFTYKSDGYYHSKSVIKGNTTVRLCQGIALNELDIDLTADNFRMEVYTVISRA